MLHASHVCITSHSTASNRLTSVSFRVSYGEAGFGHVDIVAKKSASLHALGLLIAVQIGIKKMTPCRFHVVGNGSTWFPNPVRPYITSQEASRSTAARRTDSGVCHCEYKDPTSVMSFLVTHIRIITDIRVNMY